MGTAYHLRSAFGRLRSTNVEWKRSTIVTWIDPLADGLDGMVRDFGPGE